MKRQRIIVTGATGGMGKALGDILASQGNDLVLAVRNLDRGQALADSLARYGGLVSVLHLDLADPASILSFVKEIKKQRLVPDAVIHNAGTMNRNYRSSGFVIENTMAVNVLGTALLTRQLLPILQDNSRIVFTTSLTRRFFNASKIHLDVSAHEFSQLGTYGRSKTAISLYAAWLQNEYPQYIFNCADPGIVDTGMIAMDRWFDPLANILFRPIIRKPRTGARAAMKALGLDSGCHLASVRSISALRYSDSADKLIEDIERRIAPYLIADF